MDAFAKKANVYQDKLYNKIKIRKNGVSEFLSNLKAMRRAKGGLSTRNKDVWHGYFKDLFNQVPKIEPVNFDNCNTRLLSHDNVWQVTIIR